MVNTLYLVTGAAGHLGSTVVRELCARGQRVRALVLLGDQAAAYLPSEAEIYYGDVTDPEGLAGFFAAPEGERRIVIHAAGIVSIASRFDPKVQRVNVQGTKNVVDLCMQTGVDKLVHVSSVHAIPELPHGQTVTEISHFDPDKVVGLYAKTKAEATQYVLDAASRGLNASVVHPSGITGPYDRGRGHLTQLLVDYCNGSLSAGVHGGYDFVDVRDVASGIISCCEKGRSGECYILSNRYFEIGELFEIFSKVTGRRRIKTMLPMWFAKSTAGLSELYYRLKKQPPLYTAYSLYTLSSNALFSNQKARRELDYSTRPFDQTIADTLLWLTELGRIRPQDEKKSAGGRKKISASRRRKQASS